MQRKVLFVGAAAVGLASFSGCSGQQAANPNTAPIQVPAKTHAADHARPAASPTFRLIAGDTAINGIVSFDLPASQGNIAPHQAISGSNTDLLAPLSVAVGPAGDIYSNQMWEDLICITSCSNVHTLVPVFAADANGDASPVRTVNVDPEGVDAQAVAVDSNANLYVAGWNFHLGSGMIMEFAKGANGNATPIRTISGDKTKLSAPVSISVDSSGTIYVANIFQCCSNIKSSILEFSPSASGNVAPVADIEGSYTQLTQPFQISFDSTPYEQRILVAEWVNGGGSGGKVLEFGPGASGNVAPFAVITSVRLPAGVVSDSSGNIWVSAYQLGSVGSPAISEFGPNANGNAKPIFSIEGSNTELGSPSGGGPSNLAVRNL